MMSINKKYALLFALLFLTEILIATYLDDGFIRHTFGDFLVVILLYCAVKSICNCNSTYVVIGVLIFAFGIEFLQLTPLLKTLGLENNQLAKLIFGSTFHISDLIAYTLGSIVIILTEKYT